MIWAKTIHRTSAVILIAFVLTHLSVHLTALAGPEAHAAALGFVQRAYRPLPMEALLVSAVAIQIVTGASRLRFSGIGGWDLAQVVSGCYLLMFLFLHTSAALYTHHLFGIETDFYWAAGSMYFAPIKYGFMLYYGAAVTALFTHLAAAVHFGWRAAPPALPRTMPFVGVVVGGLIVTAFSGLLYPIEIGPEVAAYYQQNFGWLDLTRKP